MTTLLAYFVKYFAVLYLDPRYRITNSATTGVATNGASLWLTGPILSWHLTNDRGQIQLYVAATEVASSGNWFGVSLIKQFLDETADIDYLSTEDEIQWVQGNLERLEGVFRSKPDLAKTCESLRELRRANSDRYWTAWRKAKGIIE